MSTTASDGTSVEKSQAAVSESNSPGKQAKSLFRRSIFPRKPKGYKPDENNEKEKTDASENVSSSELKGGDSAGTSDTAQKAEDANNAVGLFELFRFLTPFEIMLDIIGLVAAAAAGAAQPLMSIVFGSLTHSFVKFGTQIQNFSDGTGSSEQVQSAAADFRHSASLGASYLVYIGLAILVTTFAYMYFWVYTGEANARRVREKYLAAVLRQDIAYFDTVGAGEVASRIQTDTHLLQQGTSEKVPMVMQFLGSFVAGFVVAYVRSWRLALALTSMLPCLAIAGGIMGKLQSKYTKLSLRYVADASSLAEEVISTIRTAQAFGTQKVLSDLYDGYASSTHLVEKKSALINGVGMASFVFVIYASYGLAFSFGTTLIIHGHGDVGTIVSVIIAIFIGSLSLVMLAPEMQAISNARGAAAKLYATIDRVPPIDSRDPAGLKPDKVIGEIVFEHVDFNYPSRPDVRVIKDLSITFPAGHTCALVGASGSGKSTVVSLIERFYDPLSGRVRLDGVDIKELNLKWLRQQIGLVSQEPVLFSTTIAENVAYGLIGSPWENAPEDEKMARIKDACVKANADGFVSKLPDGYNTLVGERGYLLSGGQKQRVAIARAIVSDPRILLLDEATSALDTQSEGIVQDALDKAAAGRTTITIAHRLSTIKNADCIYVMGDGVVVEKGRHDELLRNPEGAYARLVQAQKLREAKEKPFTSSGADSDDVDTAVDLKQDLDKEAEKRDVPLSRQNTEHSLTSELAKERQERRPTEHKEDYSLFYIMKRFGELQGNVWKTYIYGSIFAIVSGAGYPAFGVLYANAISAFQTDDHHKLRHSGDRNALWFFILAILYTFFMSVANYAFSAAAANLLHKLRSLTFRAILRQDIEYFDKEDNSTGSLTAGLSGNPQKVNGLAGVTLGAIVQSTSTIVVGGIIGLIFQWKLALIGIACMPLIVSSGYIRLRVVVMKDQENKKEHEQSAQIACEAAGAIRTVASLTREDDCCRMYSASLEEPMRRSNKTSFYSNLIYALSQAVAMFVIALVFWYGAQRVSHLEFGTTAFFVSLFSVTFGALQAGGVFSFVPDISSARSSGSEILRMMDAVPEIDAESKDGKVLDHVQGQLVFEDVHFRYPTRPAVRVLCGMSFRAEPGSYIALVGASGCGKSTAIQLIERFYDPLSGRILLDGNDISGLNIQNYRRHIALVSQEPTLYAGTIRFNILLGAVKPHDEVTQEEIEEACRSANILDFIHSLPQGFDTEVGGKGSQLSGGQKQRIAIARALLRNPKVLLLDEATSALDSTSEKVVQQALDQAAKGRTTIAIAHRLSTIQNADCIYFINEGRVSESGTHEQLLALKGGYYEYVQLQALSRSTGDVTDQ